MEMIWILWAITLWVFYHLWKQKKVPGFILVVGFALILWADAVCDFFKLDYSTGTVRIFISTTILLYLASKTPRGERVLRLIKGQLGA